MRLLASLLVVCCAAAAPRAAAAGGLEIDVSTPVPIISYQRVPGYFSGEDAWRLGGLTGGLAWRFLVAQAGTTFAPWQEHGWRDAFVRLGVAPLRLEPPDGSASFRLVALATYHYLGEPLDVLWETAASGHRTYWWHQHGVGGRAGIEHTWWVTRRAGFSLRFLIGADALVRPSLVAKNGGDALPNGPTETVAAVDLRLELGLALRTAPRAAPWHRRRRPVTVRLYLQPPFLLWVMPWAGDFSGPSIFGAAAAVELQERFLLEAGSLYAPVVRGAVTEGFVRAGVVPVIRDHRDEDGLGWVTQAVALLGYRYLNQPGGGDGPDTWPGHGASFTFGVQATYWARSHFGIMLRLIGATSLIVRRSLVLRSKGWIVATGPYERDAVVDFGLQVGLAF